MGVKARTHSFEVGDTVRLTSGAPSGPDTGTVTQTTARKVRVLFPVRKFVWLYPSEVVKVGRVQLVTRASYQGPMP